MNIKDYIYAVHDALMANPELRIGQAYFNVLYTMYPDIANGISGTELDPFYDSNRIPKLLNYLSVMDDLIFLSDFVRENR